MNQNDTGKNWAAFCAYFETKIMNQNDTGKIGQHSVLI